VNLLAEDLLCEVVAEIRKDGTFELYQDKISLTPEIVARLCQTFVQLAGDLARRHGLTLRLGVPASAGPVEPPPDGEVVAGSAAKAHELREKGSKPAM